MSSTTCPDCGSPASGAAGAIVDCESCGASFYPAATPELLPAAAPDPPPSSVGEGAGPTDVGAWTSGGIALVATGAFYTAVIPWVRDTYLGELFAGRGWVPYGITWLSAWAAVMLLRKASSGASDLNCFQRPCPSRRAASTTSVSSSKAA